MPQLTLSRHPLFPKLALTLARTLAPTLCPKRSTPSHPPPRRRGPHARRSSWSALLLGVLCAGAAPLGLLAGAAQAQDEEATAARASAAGVAADGAAGGAADGATADAATAEGTRAEEPAADAAGSDEGQGEPAALPPAAPADPAEAAASTAGAEEAAVAGASTSGAPPEGIVVTGIPAANFDNDNGFGFGAIAAVYFNDGKSKPYRTAVQLQLFMTTKLVQDHNILIDSLRVFDLPLRLTARIGYLQSLTQNYCGLGGSVTCDPRLAEQAAAAAGLEGEEAELFARRFYQRRFINPYGVLQARYAIVERTPESQLLVELTGGYRGYYFVPGNWFDDEDGDGQPDLFPYPGSLYARDFPTGEPGFSSVLEAGLMLDSRDNEPNPTEGFWIEASVRGATPLWLSSWMWGGVHATARGYRYLPLHPALERRLVVANRLTFDGVIGDIPIQEMARIGGSRDFYAFGGADIGRGIRVQRFLGKLKVFDQFELRYRFWDFDLFDQAFALSAVGFADMALIGDEVFSPRDLGASVGWGGALRLAWNENFIIRLDVAVSPQEAYNPAVYFVVGQPF